MKSAITFSCSRLVNGQRGILVPDADGYYEQVAGALNVFNSMGEFYPYEPAKELFESSSSFMRRIDRGALRSEWDHPEWKQGWTEDDYIARCHKIMPDRVCGHIRRVTLDFDRLRDDAGKPLIAIVIEVRPSGPFGANLKDSFDNGCENTCFSIRSFTDDRFVGGVNQRHIKQIITWDYVNEPGIKYAEKYRSPGLESFGIQDDFRTTVTRGSLERMATQSKRLGLGHESVRMNIDELFTSMGWSMQSGQQPSNFFNW